MSLILVVPCIIACIVFMDEFIMRPEFELDKILSFVGYRASRDELKKALTNSLPQLEHQLSIFQNEPHYNCDSSRSSISSSTTVTNNILNSQTINEIIIPRHLLDAGKNAIQSEMKATKELTKWPCKSFRELDATTTQSTVSNINNNNKGIKQALPLSAKQLAANCNDKRVVCSVHYDRNGG